MEVGVYSQMILIHRSHTFNTIDTITKIPAKLSADQFQPGNQGNNNDMRASDIDMPNNWPRIE
jgi:hypothetical protein